MENYDINRHSIYKLQYHLVVVTKYRNKVINFEINKRLKEIVFNLFETKWKLKIIEVETETDHIHIVFEGNPQTQLSKLINNFKTVSSRLIRKEFKEHISNYYWKIPFWSPSYCITSIGGVSLEVIKKYVQSQNKPSSY